MTADDRENSGQRNNRIEKLRKYVFDLTAHGEREVGSEGHQAARKYLHEEMNKLGLAPYRGDSLELPYDRDGIHFMNFIGRVPGTSSERPPVLIGSHYDTLGKYPGADDNASAVAIVLIIAEMLKPVKMERDVIIAVFDAEEDPYSYTELMGSVAFYNEQRIEKIDCAFIMDLVGHDVPLKGFEDLLFVTGMESNSKLEEVIRETGTNGRIRIVPTLNEYIGDTSDQHIFRKKGVPFLFLSCGRWEHYHKPTDTPEKLNYIKMEAISDYLFRLVVRCDSIDFSEGLAEYDTTETEAQFINNTFSEFLQEHRMSALRSRMDISRMVEILLNRFKI